MEAVNVTIGGRSACVQHRRGPTHPGEEEKKEEYYV